MKLLSKTQIKQTEQAVQDRKVFEAQKINKYLAEQQQALNAFNESYEQKKDEIVQVFIERKKVLDDELAELEEKVDALRQEIQKGLKSIDADRLVLKQQEKELKEREDALQQQLESLDTKIAVSEKLVGKVTTILQELAEKEETDKQRQEHIESEYERYQKMKASAEKQIKKQKQTFIIQQEELQEAKRQISLEQQSIVAQKKVLELWNQEIRVKETKVNDRYQTLLKAEKEILNT